MDISLEELADLICKKQDQKPFTIKVAENAEHAVIVRTVTHYYVGRLVGEDERWLYLADCAWVADTGRWSTALSTGKLNEVEPYPDGVVVRVAVGAVVDISDWNHKLPRSVQ